LRPTAPDFAAILLNDRPVTAAPRDAPAGFSRRVRLTDGAHFDAVFDHRTRMHTPHFACHVAPNAAGHARLGLSVSRRVSKRAVQRNRIKRVIRESFRRHRRLLGATDYVVVAKSDAAAQGSTRLRAQLDNMWRKAEQKCARA